MSITASRLQIFQSTLPMQGATWHAGLGSLPCISIHAPNAGSDVARPCRGLSTRYFNPRSQCRERPVAAVSADELSTYFNPRSQCRERPAAVSMTCVSGSISIHAPNAGSDHASVRSTAAHIEFQSTLPMQGATRRACAHTARTTISIHAPNAGSDGLGQLA